MSSIGGATYNIQNLIYNDAKHGEWIIRPIPTTSFFNDLSNQQIMMPHPVQKAGQAS